MSVVFNNKVYNDFDDPNVTVTFQGKDYTGDFVKWQVLANKDLFLALRNLKSNGEFVPVTDGSTTENRVASLNIKYITKINKIDVDKFPTDISTPDTK